jgi:DNA-binding transcriptional LysR family regulator
LFLIDDRVLLMNLSFLHTLAAILDHGSLAAAAREVRCTPSAISLQVKQMERFFGQPLFDRSGRTVKPTAFAVEVGRVARECIGRIDALRARRVPAVAGRWRLGAIATAQTDLLPQALQILRERHPSLTVSLRVDDSDALLQALNAAAIDGALLIRPPRAAGSRKVAWERVVVQPFVMLAPADSLPATPQQLLAQLGWIRYDTALTGGRAAARYVRRVCPGAAVRMDVRPIDAIVAMVSAGLGVSVVPRPRAALLASHGLTAIPLGRDAPARELSFVRRVADVGDRNADAVVAALRDVCALD